MSDRQTMCDFGNSQRRPTAAAALAAAAAADGVLGSMVKLHAIDSIGSSASEVDGSELKIKNFDLYDQSAFVSDQKTEDWKRDRLWILNGYRAKRTAKGVRKFFDAFRSMKGYADEPMVFYDTDVECFVKVGKSGRWSGDGYKYQRKISRKVVHEVAGLRSLCIVTLTQDKNIMRVLAKAEGWPYWETDQGVELFFIRYGAELVGAFLKRLRAARKRAGLAWNYVGWFMQLFNDAGQVHIHFHILFYGNFVAKLSTLQRLWPYSSPQHVDVKRRGGTAVASYVARYVGRELNSLCFPGREWLAAFVYHFKRRFFSLRKRAGMRHVESPEFKRKNLVYVCPGGSFNIEMARRWIEERCKGSPVGAAVVSQVMWRLEQDMCATNRMR